ncbi:hypothetical protein PENSPDRAFT_577930 [Peniophora sp. CONT]|nr:hypothetical protein PENSPDRAFT_577930 [Peniophora sp. CONT]
MDGLQYDEEFEEDAEDEDDAAELFERLTIVEEAGEGNDGLDGAGEEDAGDGGEGGEGDGPGGGGGGEGPGGGGGGGGGPGGGGPGNAPAPVPPPPPSKHFIKRFNGRAGEPLGGVAAAGNGFATYEANLPASEDPNNPYHPFVTKMDWDIANWAKTYSIGANALTALLKVDGLVDRLKLKFRNNRELNRILDRMLPPRANFVRRTKVIEGEKVELYLRDTLEVVKEIYGRPDFAKYLVFAPEKRYQYVLDALSRAYSDMHTGNWWWEMQKRLEEEKPGATIIPLIVSSDKTQLTQFRNRSAYPVYLTIGNLPKELRRKPSLQGQILVGYLPVTKLEHIKNAKVRRRAQANIFHTCMIDIFEPLRAVAQDGVVLTSGDGVRRRCHPLLAAFVGDYPEQVLVTGIKSGLCPKGKLDSTLFGDLIDCEPRDPKVVLEALRTRDKLAEDPEAYVEACAGVGIKPIKPFWEHWPHADIFAAIMPDILHQLYQGVVKHLISWLKSVHGAKAIDDRFKRLPPNHQLRLFSKGISGMSRVTGSEHQDICRVLLGVIVDMPIPGKGQHPRAPLVSSVRALLDFVYIAQYEEASEQTLTKLTQALKRFHDNKNVFIKEGARKNFNLPKLHGLSHYADSIRLFGTADNFNTSYSERLHIDYTKNAYRSTNRKDEYPQMTLWLQRREQLLAHRTFVDWRLQGRPSLEDMVRAPQPGALKLKQNIARTPSRKSLSFADAERLYGAEGFESKLKETIVKTKFPNKTDNQVATIAGDIELSFGSVCAFHRLKFWHGDTHERNPDLVQDLPDSIQARPAYRDTQKRQMQGRFNTALIDEFGDAEEVGLRGYRVGQVRLIFSLAEKARESVFSRTPEAPTHFAYVEWFSRIPGAPEPSHGMYSIERERVDNERVVSIIPMDRIKRSVSLLPRFGPRVDPAWTSDNVLELCQKFYMNPFSDKHAYMTLT